MTVHFMDVETAKKVGVNAAIIIANLAYLQANREAQGGDKYYMQERWWVHHTYESLAKQHPYFSVQQIRRIMRRLLEQRAVFHCSPDRWNRDSYWSVAHEFTHVSESTVACVGIDSSQVSESTVVLHDNKHRTIGRSPSNRFEIPTLEMVTDYCSDRANGVDPEAFIDFYESKGWMIGKNKMKCWKAAIRTWARSERVNKTNQPKDIFL